MATTAVRVLDGTIDVAGPGADTSGGSITVSALDVEVAAGALLNADGGSDDAGSISLEGRTGSVLGRLRAKGSSDGDGGTVTLRFCSVTIAGALSVSGAGEGSAGSTDVTAGSIHITASAELTALACDPPCHFLTAAESPTIDAGADIDPSPPAIVIDPGLSACCGNGTPDLGEQCDDGNTVSGDCCAADCTLEAAQSACPDEGNLCTDDVCDGAGACLHLDNTAPCDDGDACTVQDACVAGTCSGDPACGDGIAGAACGEECDDGNTTSGDGCSADCRIEFVCPPAPVAGCRRPIAPATSQLLVTRSADGNGRVMWKWTKGSMTTKPEYGTPLTTTDYLLCLYDAGSLVTSTFVPAGQICAGKPCWKETTQGFKYADKEATPAGITALQLTQGLAPGKAKILVKGKGANLAMPDLPIAEPVVVQLRNGSTNVCWEAAFSAPAQRNDDGRYKAKSD